MTRSLGFTDMLSTFTAIYDANVLYPSTLRSLLLYLALSGLFRARWSEHIHHEWMRNLLANQPHLQPEQLERTRHLMDAHAPGCLVSGYEPLINNLVLPDPNDRHVLAAAIVAQAGVIVTFNLSDFPIDATRPYGIEAQHPDIFIQHLIDLKPQAVLAAAREHRQSLQKPAMTAEHYIVSLERQQLPITAAHLRDFMAFI